MSTSFKTSSLNYLSSPLISFASITMKLSIVAYLLVSLTKVHANNPTPTQLLMSSKSALVEFLIQKNDKAGTERSSSNCCDTVYIQLHRDWAPGNYQRLIELISVNYFSDNRFFRTIGGFVTQFGISGSPDTDPDSWKTRFSDTSIPGQDTIKPNTSGGNKRGTLVFAQSEGDASQGILPSRTTQMFINYKDNAFLDQQHFCPVGVVVGSEINENPDSNGGPGMIASGDAMSSIVDRFYNLYSATTDGGPSQDEITTKGNSYLDTDFPELTQLVGIRVVQVIDSNSNNVVSMPNYDKVLTKERLSLGSSNPVSKEVLLNSILKKPTKSEGDDSIGGGWGTGPSSVPEGSSSGSNVNKNTNHGPQHPGPSSSSSSSGSSDASSNTNSNTVNAQNPDHQQHKPSSDGDNHSSHFSSWLFSWTALCLIVLIGVGYHYRRSLKRVANNHGIHELKDFVGGKRNSKDNYHLPL